MTPPVQMMRSYASDAADSASAKPQWLLFVRQEKAALGGAGAFVFSAVVLATQQTDTCALYEQRLDGDAMEHHIEELGIEVDTAAFGDLLLKTLAQRDCVDVAIAEDSTTVDVVLTYKFSASVSRRGLVGLECVAQSLPVAVATLLTDVHTVNSHESILTPLQKLQRQSQTQTYSQAVHKTSTSRLSLPLSQESTTSASDGDAIDASTSATATANNPSASQVLKRRHVPTGTARRKGPRGAKLAKIE